MRIQTDRLRHGLAGILLVVSLFGIVLGGCEETLTDSDVDLPYVEEIFVQGRMTVGEPVEELLITRTLPPLESWTPEKAAIPDAVGFIRVDGTEHPLRYTGKGRYTVDDMIPEAGKTYELVVRWKDYEVTAITSAPAPGSIDSIVAEDYYQDYCGDGWNSVQIVAQITPHTPAAYRIGYEQYMTYDRDTEVYRWFTYDVETSADTSQDGKLRMDIISLCEPDDPGIDFGTDSLAVVLHTYDEKFYTFFKTYWEGSDDDNPFANPGSEQPEWNVTGDGFGHFFARSVTKKSIVLGE